MRELQERQKIKRRLYSVPALCLLILVTIFFAHGAYGVWQKELESANYVKDLQDQSSSLAKRQQELKSFIGRLDTEQGLEKAIKSKFSVSKPGEEVAVIVDPKDIMASSTAESLPWYQKLWGAIMSAI